MSATSPKRIIYNLEAISDVLFERFPEAMEIFLFGSRRHRTRSERSDIDLILRHDGFIKPSAVRSFIDEVCPALDIFLVEGVRAVSVVNDSYIESTDFASLLEVLSAVKVWDRSTGKADADVDWEMIVRADVIFTQTVLPNILLIAGDQLLDEELVKDTRSYIEKIAAQVNKSYKMGVLDGCAVLCRRLIETLIIEVYEAKGLSSAIKRDGNYLMLDGLINVITTETSFDIGRNAKCGLPTIKNVGDRCAHSRHFNAKYNDIESLRLPLRDSVESLVQTSGIQRVLTSRPS